MNEQERHCHCNKDGGNSERGRRPEESRSCRSAAEERNAAHSCCSSHSHGKSGPACCGGGDSAILSTRATLVLSALSLAAGFALLKIYPNFNPFLDPSWIAVILCGLPIMKEAWNSLTAGERLSSPALISVAMMGTVMLQITMLLGAEGHMGHEETSYIFAAGEIAFLMACGEALEARTVRKSQAGIERLAALAPSAALKKVGGDYVETPVGEIRAGDVLLVKPHTMIPADGMIVSGMTSVDCSNFTGESMPVEKSTGDEVLGATFNLSGAIEMRAAGIGETSALGKLAKLVEEAAGKRAPITRLAAKWASYLVPAAIVSAAAIFLIARFAFAVPAIDAFVRAVTALVVFCPCAFVLATPTAISAAIGNLSKRGVLVKSGAAIEEMSKVNAVFFDKTGTLTRADIKVSEEEAFECGEVEMLSLALTAEQFSEHPIARAINTYARQKGAVSEKPIRTKSLAGSGVECETPSGKIEVLRAEKFYEQISASKKMSEFIKTAYGKTIAAVAFNGKIRGLIALSDEIKKDAAYCVAELKNADIGVSILTGDNAASAKLVADAIGVSDVLHSAMPADKLAQISAARESGKTVCMVGDGVNDAPALAAANCSMAFGKLGNDIAVESADITLLGENISAVSEVLAFSRRVIGAAKANMIVSLAVSFAAILASAFGLLGPVAGALIHNVSSVAVVGNSARLLASKRDFKSARRRNISS